MEIDPPRHYGHVATAPDGTNPEDVRLIEINQPGGRVLVHNRAGYEFLIPATQVSPKP